MLLQSPNYRQKLGDDSHFFGFQQSSESANDSQSVIFGEIPAEPFINQNKVRFVAQGFGDGVAFAGITTEKIGLFFTMAHYVVSLPLRSRCRRA